MRAKQLAAIIEGTMASPSSPSVRLTALEAPVMTKIASAMNNQPKSISTFLRNGTARAVLMVGSRVSQTTATAATALTTISASSLPRPASPDEERLVSF